MLISRCYRHWISKQTEIYIRVVYYLIVNCLHHILPTALLSSKESSERRKTSIHTTDNELLDGPGYEVEEPMQEAIEGGFLTDLPLVLITTTFPALTPAAITATSLALYPPPNTNLYLPSPLIDPLYHH